MILILFLHTIACHTINDGIPSWIHVSDGVGHGYQCEDQDDRKPEYDVEDYGIVGRVDFGNVEFVSLKQICIKKCM